ncbi:Zwei Ig domain protein zig-8 [Frankliniella fusca]|uniref:Zwei Ig domain protein zig-8 n=1 Tax=Frankliniella fusca TaxID=407009 RepID=A0AAE1L9L0_9NEOP|nr:Zwei Ig domain protein zig-8 [Frankliniella fusca]
MASPDLPPYVLCLSRAGSGLEADDTVTNRVLFRLAGGKMGKTENRSRSCWVGLGLLIYLPYKNMDAIKRPRKMLVAACTPPRCFEEVQSSRSATISLSYPRCAIPVLLLAPPHPHLSWTQTWNLVSWVRHRDIHLLTVARYTYTNDQRFRATHAAQSDDWILQLKYPQHRDAGIYECQVSTTPHLSHFIHLSVVAISSNFARRYSSAPAPRKFFSDRVRLSDINKPCFDTFDPKLGLQEEFFGMFSKKLQN